MMTEALQYATGDWPAQVLLDHAIEYVEIGGVHAGSGRHPGQPQQYAKCLELDRAHFIFPARVEGEEGERVALDDADTRPHGNQRRRTTFGQSGLQVFEMLSGQCLTCLWISSGDFTYRHHRSPLPEPVPCGFLGGSKARRRQE